MKNWLLILALGFCRICSATAIQDHKIDPQALSQLTSAFGIPPDADLISETQKRWLRKPGQERWEIEELSPSVSRFVLDWAENQALFKPWKPALETYDQALILGGTTSRMQMRLDYLKELWLQGIRFKKIVFLTGDRPLDPRVDDLITVCSNESEAAKLLWESSSLPETMRQLPILFIAVPLKAEGKRPTTEDTIHAWLKTIYRNNLKNRNFGREAPSNFCLERAIIAARQGASEDENLKGEPTPPKTDSSGCFGINHPCTALFVSNQPYCGYQFAVIKKYLPQTIHFDLVGPGAEPATQSAAIVLDTIARWIYQEK